MKKLSRAVDRQKRYTLPAARAAHGGRALLEDASVQERTRIDYAKRIKNFFERAQTGPIQLMKAEYLDMALVDYFDEEFLAGESCDVANRLLAAIAFYHPAYSRKGDLGLPGACRAAKDWKRGPLSGRIAHATPGNVGDRGRLHRDGRPYGRPRDRSRLLLLPQARRALRPHRRPVDHASRLGSRGVDVGAWSWGLLSSDAYLRELSRLRPPTAKIWPFDTNEFCRRFVAAGKAAGVGVLGLYPYSLRHGGASWDALGRRRSIEMSDSSLRRCEKASRALQQAHRLSLATTAFAAWVQQHVAHLFRGTIQPRSVKCLS